MNLKRYLLAALAAFVIMHAAGFAVHAVLLDSYYKATAELWRPEGTMGMGLLEVYYAAFALLMTCVFVHGRKAGGWLEGLRFGALLGLLMPGLHYLILYWSMPVSCEYACTGFAGDYIGVVLAGIAVSCIYKPR